MAVERPARVMDPYAAEFWEYTARRELRLQRCDGCGAMRWPPSAACDRCLDEHYVWALVSGEGQLISWVTFRRQYFPEYPPPHTAVAVELREGPLFISALTADSTAGLAEGTPMRLTWVAAHDRFGNYNLPVFEPVTA